MVLAPKSSILMRFSINHPFGGTPVCGNPHIEFNSSRTIQLHLKYTDYIWVNLGSVVYYFSLLLL